jgi:hypothetical protein
MDYLYGAVAVAYLSLSTGIRGKGVADGGRNVVSTDKIVPRE